jgi:hypothetical protein
MDILRATNQRLVAYSEELLKDWFPMHGTGNFNISITCASKDWTNKVPGNGDYDNTRYYLHAGGFRHDLPICWIDNWVSDLDHGIFHGLMVGFIAYLHDPLSIAEWLADFVLHDFLKCSMIPDHDRLLKNYFCLHPETYHHSLLDDTSPLTIGDKVESLKSGESLPDHQEMIQCFYTRIRGHLEKLFQDRDDVWARHADERNWGEVFTRIPKEFLSHRTHHNKEWPVSHWCPVDENFAVDIGHLLGQDLKANRLILDLFQTQALISRRRLIELNKEIRPARDHFMVNGRIPVTEWVFVNCHPADDWETGYVAWDAALNLLIVARQLEASVRFIRQDDNAQNDGG